MPARSGRPRAPSKLRAAPAGVIAAVVLAAAGARGDVTGPAVQLAALAPADDARRAIAIGRHGEIYEPDGQGGWVHRLPCSLVEPVTAVGRAGGQVLVQGDGAIYRLAGNGWSAIRLVPHSKTILGRGARTLAAVGDQLFALDGPAGRAPIRLAQAPTDILAIGAGPGAIVIATEAGVLRRIGATWIPLSIGPGRPRLASERWAIDDHGAIEMTTGQRTAWPPGLAIDITGAAPGGALVAVGPGPAGLELVTLGGGRIARDPLGVSGTPVGVVVDRAGRAVVALADGRLAVRARPIWSIVTVTEAPAPDRPGAAPARSEQITETSAADPR